MRYKHTCARSQHRKMLRAAPADGCCCVNTPADYTATILPPPNYKCPVILIAPRWWPKRFLLWFCVSVSMAVHAADTASLENTVLRMDIAKSPVPFIAQLIHKASGVALIAGPAHRNLFTLTLAKPDGNTVTLESSQAGTSSVHHEGDRLMLRFGKFPNADLNVEASVSCTTNDTQSLWSLRVENKTGLPLKTVRFPQFLAVPAIGEAQDDVLVLPAYAGALIENPATNWKNGQSMTLRYPGDMSAQFLAYQDRKAGLYLAGTDTAGHPMTLTVFKQPDGYACWHEFTPVAVTDVWQSPYPVVLGVTQGRWCETADQYKRWAEQQSWCAKKLVDREDIPEWWKAGPDVHVCCVRTYDNTRACNDSYYPKLREHMQTFRDKIDGPVVAMLAGWENHRRWTAGDYFPIFDDNKARPVITQLRQDGIRPFFFLSGLYYTFRNEGRDGGDVPAAQSYLASFVEDAKANRPKEYVLNESNPQGDWKRHSYQFCVGAPQTESFFRSVIDQAHARGVDVLQMDQTTSGAGDACYATTHGHAPGAGLYQSHEFWKLLDSIRRHGKQRESDFVLFHEEPHEQLIPHLDGFHVREYYEKRWYRGAPGAVGIPLFDYLYHEYALGYGGDSAGLSKDNNRWNVRCHALNFVTGRAPGGAVWSAQQNMFDAHADQIAMLRNHSRLLKTRARDCLLLGRMLHPFELATPSLTTSVPAQRGGKWVQEEIATPAILTSSWQAPDGRIGHLFINFAEDRQPLKVRLDTRNAPALRTCSAEIHRSTSNAGFQPLWSDVTLPKEFTAQLEPAEAVFIELRESK